MTEPSQDGSRDEKEKSERGAVLVTGAARRIGAAIATVFAQAGYRVAVHARESSAEAEALCETIRKDGGQAATVIGDLADDAQTLVLIARAVELVGPLRVLVNNASLFEPDGGALVDAQAFDRHMAVNLRAPLLLAQVFAAQVQAGTDSSIVNIVDQRVAKPTPQFMSYSLSKHGLATATTMLAQALAPAIRVNAVGPGPVMPSPRQSDADFHRQAATLPLGRPARPDDIARATLFLAQATAITGQTIFVDGGQHIAWQTPDVTGMTE
jgi:NAD(P)-dependent dehydrogenase (short-subunit alcohol dehydrogenase family)